MPKKFLERYLPSKKTLARHRHLGFLAAHLRRSELWRLTRRSVAGGMAVGLFVAFLPIPLQMVLAAAVALAIRVNVPVALLAVWVTNPFTLTPIGYLAYRTGTWLLDTPGVATVPDETTFQWLMSQTARVWRPLLVGGLVLGTVASVLGYVAVRVAWRLHVAYRWRRRSGADSPRMDGTTREASVIDAAPRGARPRPVPETHGKSCTRGDERG